MVNLFLINVLVSGAVCVVKTDKYSKANRPSLLLLQPSLLGEYTVNKKMDCANKCSRNAGCASFLFGTAYPPDHCYSTPFRYQWAGRWSITQNGRACQSFASQYPHSHIYTVNSMYPDGSVAAAGNNCRDPGKNGYLWCYTTNPSVRWETCDILPCTSGNCYLYSAHHAPGVDLGIYEYFYKITQP